MRTTLATVLMLAFMSIPAVATSMSIKQEHGVQTLCAQRVPLNAEQIGTYAPEDLINNLAGQVSYPLATVRCTYYGADDNVILRQSVHLIAIPIVVGAYVLAIGIAAFAWTRRPPRS